MRYALALILAAPGLAYAEPPNVAERCALTFDERLADAKRALTEYELHMAERTRAAPAVEWFHEHCRFLEQAEILRRKLDDTSSFVCDPGARGRPSGLTAELVLEYSTAPAINQGQRFHGDNYACVDADRAAGRIALALPPDASPLDKLELMCFGDARPACVKARADIARARAKR